MVGTESKCPAPPQRSMCVGAPAGSATPSTGRGSDTNDCVPPSAQRAPEYKLAGLRLSQAPGPTNGRGSCLQCVRSPVTGANQRLPPATMLKWSLFSQMDDETQLSVSELVEVLHQPYSGPTIEAFRTTTCECAWSHLTSFGSALSAAFTSTRGQLARDAFRSFGALLRRRTVMPRLVKNDRPVGRR